MIEPILPAALLVRSKGLRAEALLDAAVRENVRRVVGRWRKHSSGLPRRPFLP